jgi:hypothetical protein
VGSTDGFAVGSMVEVGTMISVGVAGSGVTVAEAEQAEKITARDSSKQSKAILFDGIMISKHLLRQSRKSEMGYTCASVTHLLSCNKQT